MFIGPWEAGGPWSSTGIEGMARFLNRVWALLNDKPDREGDADEKAQKDLRRAVHHAVKEVTDDIPNFQFNTAIAELMTLTNVMGKLKSAAMVETEVWQEAVQKLLLLLAPIAPHIADELWERRRLCRFGASAGVARVRRSGLGARYAHDCCAG